MCDLSEAYLIAHFPICCLLSITYRILYLSVKLERSTPNRVNNTNGNASPIVEILCADLSRIEHFQSLKEI